MLAGATPSLDSATAARLQSFVAAGYDPLTAPVSWYVHDAVPGAARTIPAPKPVGIDPVTLDEAAAWAEAQGSSALLVSLHGRLVFERYWRGDDRATPFNSQSMAKTVAALLVGIALDKHEIASVDDPMGKYLAEWRGDARGAITLRQMLQMASGLAQVDAGHGYALTPDNPAVRQYFGTDYLKPALALAVAEAPGKTFDYNNNDVLIVARMLELVSGKPYRRLLSERLWQPLGLADAEIGVDRHGGMAMASANIFGRPIDWLRLGELIAGQGALDGKRVVSARWIEAMATPSPAYRGYGYYLWLGDQLVGGKPVAPTLYPWQSAPFAAKDMVLLNGFGGQRVWIMPSKGLVVVRSGRVWPSAWDDAIIPNLLWRGA